MYSSNVVVGGEVTVEGVDADVESVDGGLEVAS